MHMNEEKSKTSAPENQPSPGETELSAQELRAFWKGKTGKKKNWNVDNAVRDLLKQSGGDFF